MIYYVIVWIYYLVLIFSCLHTSTTSDSSSESKDSLGMNTSVKKKL